MKSKILITVAFLLIFSGLKAQIPTDGLVLNLPLDGTAADSSSYKNVCENHGATPVADRTGRAGKAMAFDGYSYIRIPSTKALDLTTNRTISCWAYIPSTMIPNMYPTLVYKFEPIKSSATYCIQLCGCTCYNENHYKITALSTTDLTHYQVFTKQLYTDYYNKWVHIVSTYDTISGYMKIYLNGHISDSTYCGKVVANTSNLDLNIGCGGNSSDYRTYFNGYIDDVLLYNRALSVTEINKIYNEKFAVSAGSDKTAVCGETIKLDSVTTNNTGGGLLKYKWTPATGLNNDTIANPISTPTGVITYTVTVTKPDGTSATDNVIVSQKSFSPINTSTIYNYISCGESVKFDSIITNYSGKGKLKYKWSPSTGLNSDTIARPVCTAAQSTYYTVTITVANGCSANAYVYAYVYSNSSYYTTSKTVSCGDTIRLEAITANIANKTGLHYKWTPSTGLSSDTIATPIARLSANMTYYYTVTTSSGCVATTGSAYITYAKTAKPAIAFVGVDMNNKNIITWDKSAYSGVKTFNVYKETNIADSYVKIGTVADSVSTYTDTLSLPNVQSNRYKLSILDKCGFETDLSNYHKTMHLSINKGVGTSWNLIWESYEGYTVSTYNIYRGTSVSNITQIGTLSGNNNQFSDFSAPTGDVYYQIEAIKSSSSAITGVNKATTLVETGSNTSRSNIATNASGLSGTIDLKDISDLISICPNPASTKIDLSIGDNIISETNYFIYNTLGVKVKSDKIVETNQRINLENLANGVYMFVIKSEKKTGSHKLIIQK